MGVAKKVDAKKKGELMEQNQDALEYSSEEEGEDLKDTMASINSKGKKVRFDWGDNHVRCAGNKLEMAKCILGE